MIYWQDVWISGIHSEYPADFCLGLNPLKVLFSLFWHLLQKLQKIYIFGYIYLKTNSIRYDGTWKHINFRFLFYCLPSRIQYQIKKKLHLISLLETVTERISLLSWIMIGSSGIKSLQAALNASDGCDCVWGMMARQRHHISRE